MLVSTVVGIPANDLSEQSTVIFESLQIHWHFRGQLEPWGMTNPGHNKSMRTDDIICFQDEKLFFKKNESMFVLSLV